MANCNNLFKEFNGLIRLDTDKRVKLREKRNDLRKRVLNGFRFIKETDQLDHELEFQSQGSYVMDTIINPSKIDDQYDIDDGVYIMGNLDRYNRPKPIDFHNLIIRSIEAAETDHDFMEIKDKNTCVRVVYSGEDGALNYHVDLPSYYTLRQHEPELSDKKNGWNISNPIKFIIWFENLIESGFKQEFILESRLYAEEYDSWLNDMRKKDHQLRRIVRYLKAWGDLVKGDMPPGIVMTILAGENYSWDERDDVALKNTLINIEDYLTKKGFKCIRPTVPVGEDLFENYSASKKEYFRNALNSFIESAKQAFEIENQKRACLKWQKHLGNRFPCNLANDEIDGAKTYKSAPIIKSDNSRSA